ncbi:hypothetical protein TNIN_328831 [Trichonephila inaurata madagascariensis]|uniref:Uncharacterized protein n=1 Tax=Trichonephila inaurata madagascariensis TaxID=2747483 RepID=A0A8X6YUV4_9ARAC|nr:hypothetical protein TNIN_328831 [Trichonephila inaurata madagascariensis]
MGKVLKQVSFHPNLTLASSSQNHAYEKKGSLGRKTVKPKAVEHTRAAEAPDEKEQDSRLIRSVSLARATETPEQYQV